MHYVFNDNVNLNQSKEQFYLRKEMSLGKAEEFQFGTSKYGEPQTNHEKK